MATVSFIIATYNRPHVLRCTLESLLLQDYADWEAIIVGDRCDETTEHAIREISDGRIRYYNLPQRVGEQSGPNSVGLALASGEIVTFLNHDDLLLPDHVSYGLEQLQKDDADFFIGKAANATKLDGHVPVFTDTLPRSTDLRRLFLPPLYAFDPSSFWLIRTEYAQRVGNWKPASTIWRTPLDDWLIRAWRLGGRFVFGEAITGLRLRTHYLRKDGSLYEHDSPEHRSILDQLKRDSLSAVRKDIRDQIENAGGWQIADAPLWKRKLVGGMYKMLHIDPIAVASRFRGGKGTVLKRITRERTGEELPDPPNIEKLIANADSFRIL